MTNDKSGNVKMEKYGSNNTARDDVAFALVLAAGAWERASARPEGTLTHVVIPMRHGAGLLLHRRWQLARRAALEKDGYRCRSCGKAGVLQVDHIQPLHVGGEPYGLENLQSLCVECHF